MNAIELISQDLFDKIRSRYSNLEMGDQNGKITSDPLAARFFDFDFVFEGNNLGRVSISINDVGTLKIFYGKGILQGQDRFTQGVWFDFLREMRLFAKRRMLRFDTRDITKSNLNKDDFQYLASTGSKEEKMAESRMYGSSRSSYLPMLEKVKIIVRHSAPVSDGGRHRHIRAIYVENQAGERYKCPINSLRLAEAMGRHVANDGRPHDHHGQKIVKMAEEIAQLASFKKHAHHVVNDTMQTEANEILERACGKLDQLRECMKRISTQRGYEEWKEGQHASSEDDQMVMDQATMEHYKSQFTVNKFNENLVQYFPLIHKIMQEIGEVNLADMVSETREETCDECGMYETQCKCEKEIKEFSEFSEWTTQVAEGRPTDDQISQLKKLLDSGELDTTGLEGTPSMQALEDIGILDQDLSDAIEAAGPNGDMRTILRSWLHEKNDQDAIKELGLDNSDKEEQAAEPEETPPPEAVASPEVPETPPAEEQPPAGAEPGIAPPSPTEEDEEIEREPNKKKLSPTDVAERIQGFYNVQEGTFTLGETGVITKIEKEGGPHAARLAKKFMHMHRVLGPERFNSVLQQNIKNRNMMEKPDQTAFEDILRLSGLKK